MSKNLKKELTPDEIEFITKSSGMDDSIVKSWYKEFLQQCPTGKMNKKNFYKFYKLLRGQSDDNLSKIADRVFGCFDDDGSGYLDFPEFIIAYSSTSLGDPRKKLHFVFLFYDMDRSGTIDEKEFLKVLELLYEFKRKNKKEYPPEKMARDIFSRIDDNGDKRLCEEEFIEGCLKHEKILELISPFE